MDSFRERLSNRYQWALPDYFPGIEAMRFLDDDIAPWIRVYKIAPGTYTLRTKHQGPGGVYLSFLTLAAVLAAIAIIYTATKTVFAVAFFAVLSVPFWPLILDFPLDKVEIAIHPDGNIIERTAMGQLLLLANFTKPFVWRIQAHSEQAAAQSAGRFLPGVLRMLQQLAAATANISKRPTGAAMAASGQQGEAVSAYHQASELYLVRGPGGGVMVKVAEFIDDAHGQKAAAVRGAIERVIAAIKADMAGIIPEPTIIDQTPEPSPERERYE